MPPAECVDLLVQIKAVASVIIWFLVFAALALMWGVKFTENKSVEKKPTNTWSAEEYCPLHRGQRADCEESHKQ